MKSNRDRKQARIALILLCILIDSALQGQEAATPRTIFEQAQQCQRRGNLKCAERLYMQFLQLEPNSAEGHANLGVVLAQEKKFREAIRSYELALQIKPALHSVYLNMGIAYFRMEDFGNAVRELEKFMEFEPRNTQARHLLGVSYARVDRYREAIEMLDPLRPTGDPSVLFALAGCHVRIGQMSKAQEILQTLLTSERNSPRLHYLLGQTYVGVSRFQEAESEFRQVHALDPNWPGIYFLLGAVAARLGKADTAEAYFRQELERDPHSVEANLALGARLNREHRYDEARKLLEMARSSPRPDSDVLYELARADFHTGRVDKAWERLAAAVKADADNGPAHYLMGRIAQQRGDTQTAMREFKLAESLGRDESERQIQRLSRLTQKSGSGEAFENNTVINRRER